MGNSILVSVVVPTLNAGEPLSKLLEALMAQQAPGNVEIIVIDSGSRDGTVERARRFGAKVLSIPRYRFNHGRARNQAIQASQGQFAVLTVQDAIPVGKRWLSDLLAPLLSDDDVAGSYGVQLAPPWASVTARARSSAWRKDEREQRIRHIDSPREFHSMSPEDRFALVRFDNVTSCVRRSVWKRMPFPEDRYGEDTAWAKMVMLDGHGIAHVSSARVWHYHERGSIYEFRRAYLDGFVRAELVDWPSSDMELGEMLAGLRMMRSQLANQELDSMTDPVVIRQFLRREILECELQPEDKILGMYRASLEFAWSLLENALRFCPEGILPNGVWSDLFRFAIISEVGKEIGTTVAQRLSGGAWLRQGPWRLAHAAICRGV